MTAIAASYEIHPLALRVPGMTEQEFAGLKDDIERNGLLQPIVLFDGQVLDGRHRLRACEETGVWPAFEQYEGDSPASYVLSLNAKRRNLTTGQLAMLATDFLPDLEREARRRQGARTDLATSAPGGAEVGGRASERAGELVGVHRRSVERAKRINEEAPGLADRVRSGELPLRTAEREIVEPSERAPTRDVARKPSARDVHRQQRLVEGVAEKARLIVDLAPHLDLNAVKAIPQEEKEEWRQQLSSARTVLSRLIGALSSAA